MSAETYAVLQLDCATGSEPIVARGLDFEWAGAIAEVSPVHPPRRIIKDSELLTEVRAMIKRKFTLEFDEVPALVFVQRRVGSMLNGNTDVYIDGKKVAGVRGITVHANIDGVTTHEIEYLTGKTEASE